MTVLALIHDEDAPPGVFSGYDELARVPLARDDYDAVMIFGGEANVDDDFDWLADEKRLIGTWLDRGTPLLGVCLGAQLIAEVAGAEVRRLPRPEVGWHRVSGDGDLLPDSFLAFEWHRYGFDAAPPGAVELARNDVGCQAFTLGSALAIQFHAEVDAPTVHGWIRDYGPEVGADATELAAETEREIARWNDLGRDLCGRWLSGLGLGLSSRRPARRGAGRR